VAVAARLTPAALGSDTGGSIRLPAHFCGITGLKPTYGRVSRANAMPLSFSLDTVGPLVRTAADAALIMEAIVGPDPLDPTTVGAPAWNKATASRAPELLTIGVPSSFYVEGLDPDVAKTLDETVEALGGLGHKIVKVELPDQTLLAAAGQVILTVEAAACHAATLRERPGDYGAQVRARLENGLAYSAVEYLEALRWRGPALAAHLEAIAGVDVIVAPACQTVAPSIVDTDVGAGPNADAIIMGVTRFMRLVNFLGLPSLVVPAGRSTDGLPIGMQLIGRPFGDELVTALGQAFQSATDHHLRTPRLP
jgi:aspartyl-tRNA(Asn)/glutamyl-tRNA(Gln) amidotransferase subunit A